VSPHTGEIVTTQAKSKVKMDDFEGMSTNTILSRHNCGNHGQMVFSS